MKSTKILAASLLFFSFIFVSCIGDYDYINTTKEIITRGQWTVDYYYAGQDRTADYSGYYLTFRANGTLECQRDADTYNGTWGVQKDANGEESLLKIQLASSEPSLQELSLDWDVTEKNIGTVSLKNDTNGAQLRIRKY